MPPKVKITKDQLIGTAMELVRAEGEQAINARRIANTLGCSTQPVFSNFATMEELRKAVKDAANETYQSFVQEDMAMGKYPAYKASGMAYIRFAREETELFKLLFMCDRSGEAVTDDRESVRPLLELLKTNLGVSEEEAVLFHLEMWIYVHGIATMIATSYLRWDEDMVSRLLTDAYLGMKYRYTEGNKYACN